MKRRMKVALVAIGLVLPLRVYADICTSLSRAECETERSSHYCYWAERSGCRLHDCGDFGTEESCQGDAYCEWNVGTGCSWIPPSAYCQIYQSKDECLRNGCRWFNKPVPWYGHCLPPQ